MEISELIKYCESANLSELFDRKLKLIRLMQEKNLSNTNAATVLKVLDEYIELKKLFEVD